ncbi:MAG: hypothetical protein KDA96_22570, partial [Planctomycetaceae bacterium]|nr:hypothetical protein [Planctomycetaceae bacterium]
GFGIAGFAAIPEGSEVWQVRDYAFWQRVAFHFEHPDWVSLFGRCTVSFWDLIQPAFMFMVGVAMPFSYARRSAQSQSSIRPALHALWRSLVLVLLGVFLSSPGHPATNWVFPNVLAQIGLGYFFVYLCLGRGRVFQYSVLSAVLLGYWALFFFNPPVEGWDSAAVNASEERGEVFHGRFAAWSKNGNIAHDFDQWLLLKLRNPPPAVGDDADSNADSNADSEPVADAVPLTGVRRWFFSNPEPYPFNSGGYTTLNFIPSTATTLLGVLCGQLLLSSSYSAWKRFLLLVAAGAVCLVAGVLAHHTVCPVVKRIWTPSWVLFSGGYVIWMLALFYLLFDILPFRILAWPLVVVGANSIMMYMMGQLWRGWVLDKIVRLHFTNMIESLLGPHALAADWYGPITEKTAAFVVFWLVAFWMYRNRYLVRI